MDARHVHAYVIGEHGDSEVLTWSQVTIGGMSLAEFCALQEIVFDDVARQRIDERVRRAAYTIIEGKGATYYGIGSALARIVEVILEDQRAILTVCTPTPDVAGVADVTVALPRLVGGDGVLATFPQPLNRHGNHPAQPERGHCQGRDRWPGGLRGHETPIDLVDPARPAFGRQPGVGCRAWPFGDEVLPVFRAGSGAAGIILCGGETHWLPSGRAAASWTTPCVPGAVI